MNIPKYSLFQLCTNNCISRPLVWKMILPPYEQPQWNLVWWKLRKFCIFMQKKKFLIFKKEDFKNLENYHSLFQKWHRHFAVQLSLVFPISCQWARKDTNSLASQGELLSFELIGKGRDQNGEKKKSHVLRVYWVPSSKYKPDLV